MNVAVKLGLLGATGIAGYLAGRSYGYGWMDTMIAEGKVAFIMDPPTPAAHAEETEVDLKKTPEDPPADEPAPEAAPNPS